MKTRTMRVIAGATLMAAALYAVLAMPGFVSDTSSTVPTRTQEARR